MSTQNESECQSDMHSSRTVSEITTVKLTGRHSTVIKVPLFSAKSEMLANGCAHCAIIAQHRLLWYGVELHFLTLATCSS